MSRTKNLGGKTLTLALQSIYKNASADRAQTILFTIFLIKAGQSPTPADVTQCLRLDAGNGNASEPILATNCTVRPGRDGMLAFKVVLNPGDEIQIAGSEANAIRVRADKVYEESAA